MHNAMDWNDYNYFLTVAVEGSLSRAAKKLGVNHTTVFRRINSLEKKIAVHLFERHKNGYVLTEAGEEALKEAKRIEDHIHTIHRRLQGRDFRISGNLRISTTDTLGYYWLPPYIRRFKTQYPDITIHMDIKTGYTDLSRREADIVIPAVNKQPDYMVGRKLAPLYINLYASTDYIAQHGRPDDPEDFENHRFILPAEAISGMPANQWLRKFVPNSAIAASSDKLTGLYRLAKQGLGITPLPHYVGDPDDSMHKLMELPKGCHHEIWILTHPDLRHTARVKTFMTFMHQEIKAEN